MLALFGIVAGAWQRRMQIPLQTQHQSVVLWGVWLGTGCGFFSIAGFFHAYYLAMIAPPIAAPAGIGGALLWANHRLAGRRVRHHAAQSDGPDRLRAYRRPATL